MGGAVANTHVSSPGLTAGRGGGGGAVAYPGVSSPGLTGRPSTPRLLDSIAGISGILDHPLSRVMTTVIALHGNLLRACRRYAPLIRRRVLGPKRNLRPVIDDGPVRHL